MIDVISKLPVKKAIALLIRSEENQGLVLGCLRLETDTSYPNMWGLPAGSLKDGEAEFELIDRIMIQKLRIKNYKIIRHLGKLTAPRQNKFLLILDEFEILVESNQANCNLKEYQKCEFQDPSIFVETARTGSLCTQICLNYFNIKY